MDLWSPPPPETIVPAESSCFRRQTNRTCTVHVHRCGGRQGSGTDLMGVDARRSETGDWEGKSTGLLVRTGWSYHGGGVGWGGTEGKVCD